MIDVHRIEALLKRKREIEKLPKGSFVENQRWMLEAIEVLLRAILELRDAGLLR